MKSMKRISVITLILLFSLISSSFAETGKISSSTVRVREKASTSSEILTNVYNGDSVEIIDTEGDWYKVKVDGKTGYIKSEFITIDKANSNDNDNTNTNNSSEVYTNSKVKVRALPSIISVSVGNIELGKSISKLEEINNWVKITDGTISGWIVNTKLSTTKPEVETDVDKEPEEKPKEEKPQEEKKEESSSESKINKVAIVNAKTLRVRDKANTSGEIVDLLDYNDEVTVIGEEGSWYKIKYNNKEGYIDSSFVVMKDSQGVSSRGLKENRQQVAEEPKTPEVVQEASVIENVTINAPASGSGQAVVDFAKQFLGYPYVAAGKKPETGFDCSGFTGYVFSNFGHSLGGSAASQASDGIEVSRDGLVAGDLILFYDEGKTKIGHTGIYIGNGDFVHAANPKRGVVIDNINTSSYYNERYISARRLVQ